MITASSSPPASSNHSGLGRHRALQALSHLDQIYMIRTLAFLGLVFCVLMIGGCSSGATGDKPVSVASDQQVQDMVAARKIFDASNKEWSSLAADQKARFVKLTGGNEAQSQKWWETMKGKGASGGISTGPSSTGPQ